MIYQLAGLSYRHTTHFQPFYITKRSLPFAHPNALAIRSHTAHLIERFFTKATTLSHVDESHHSHQHKLLDLTDSRWRTTSRPFPTKVSELIDNHVSLTIRQSSLLKLSISEIAGLLSKGELTSTELMEASLIQIQRTCPMNAYISCFSSNYLLERAALMDRRRAKGESIGILDGIPIAVKDNFNVKNTPTTCASKMLERFISPYDSTVTKRLEDAGAIIVGKTNMDEFAMGSTTSNSIYGPSINPWSLVYNPDPSSNHQTEHKEKYNMLTAGGSSGGSAVALASGTVFAAIGTDTGGSVRLPASWTGLVGFKPSYGLSSRFGIVQFASSLDTPSFFTKNILDATMILQVVIGADLNDSTSVGSIPSLNLKDQSSILKPYKIGIPKEFNISEISSEIKVAWLEAMAQLEKEGCEIVPISLPHSCYGVPCYNVINSAEASSNLARYDGVRYGHRTLEEVQTVPQMYSKSRSEGFSAKVQRRILFGTHVLTKKYIDSIYLKAAKMRRLIIQDFNSAFSPDGDNVDAILTPTALTMPPSIEELQSLESIEFDAVDIMTTPSSLAGLPTVSIPFKISSTKIPIGLQLIGKGFHDFKLLDIGKLLEKRWRCQSGQHGFEMNQHLYHR